MHDMQHQRLRHLLVNAIIDLWKKETGSMSSVVIEGTICITSGAGKTTVLQVCDRFSGGIRDNGQEEGHHPGRRSVGPYLTERYATSLPPGIGFLSPSQYTDAPRVETNATAMAAMLDHLSPASLVSPITDYSRSGRESRSPSMPPPQDYPIDVSGYSAKDTANSDSIAASPVKEEKIHEENGLPETPTFAGTGYYRASEELEETSNHEVTTPMTTTTTIVANGSVQEPAEGSGADSNRDSMDSECRQETESPKTSNSGTDKPAKRLDFNNVDAMSTPAMSAAISVIHSPPPVAKDSELALSPPQNYTAQIRDVIRQRLLASRSVSHSEEGREGTDYAQDLSIMNSRASEQERFNASISDVEAERERQRRRELDMIREGRPHSRHEIERPASRDRSRSRDDERQRSRSVEERCTSASPRLVVGGYAPPPPPPHLPPHHPFAINSFIAQLPKSAIMAGHFLPHPGLPQLISTPSPQAPYKLSDIMRMRPDQTPPSGVPLMYSHAAPPMLMPREDARLNSTSSNSSSGSPRVESGGETSPTNKENSGEPQHIYKCDYCNKTFLFKSKYHEHLPVHTNARPYQCHLCNRTYKYKYDLRVHLRTHMGIPTKSTICPFCNGKFDTNKQLRAHIKMGHSDQQKASPQDCTQPVDNLPPAL